MKKIEYSGVEFHESGLVRLICKFPNGVEMTCFKSQNEWQIFKLEQYMLSLGYDGKLLDDYRDLLYKEFSNV